MSALRGPAVAVAFRTLFEGEPAHVSDPLVGLLPADLKAAFKRRALRCHPDRALTLGRSPREQELLHGQTLHNLQVEAARYRSRHRRR